jgi:hypothetical protein
MAEGMLPVVLERLDITSAEMDLTIDQNNNLLQSLFILFFTFPRCNIVSTELCLCGCTAQMLSDNL